MTFFIYKNAKTDPVTTLPDIAIFFFIFFFEEEGGLGFVIPIQHFTDIISCMNEVLIVQSSQTMYEIAVPVG